MRAWALVILTGLLTGACGAIREHRNILQPLESQLTASVGSSLFRLNKQRDLPNVWGGRDITGGKVARGFAEVRLIGISDDQKVDVRIFDVNADNTENTLDRYFMGVAATVDVNQNVNLGDDSGEGGTPVTVDLEVEASLVVAGVELTFLEVRQNSVVYTLRDLLHSSAKD